MRVCRSRGISIAGAPPTAAVRTAPNTKLAPGSLLTGTIQLSGDVASAVVTYAQRGTSLTEQVPATVTAGQTVNGVTTYTWTAPRPITFTGVASATIQVTDRYGQVTTSAPVYVVIQ